MALTIHSKARSLSVKWPALANIRGRLAVWRSRRALAALDARALDDIGITPAEARREAELGLWDVPATWRNR